MTLPLDPVLVDDYAALRHGVGAVWGTREAVMVDGPQALEYLQGQLSQDLEALAPAGGSALSFLLQPQGKVDALLRVTRVADDRFLLDVDAGWGQPVVDRLRRFRLRTKVEIDLLGGWGCLSLRGPAAGEVEVAGGPGAAAVPALWPGVAGVEHLGPDLEVPEGVRVCGSGPGSAWSALRVEAGVPLMGVELTEKTIPAESGMVGPAVSFTKGCYTGQELVARLDARGNKVPRRLLGVVVAPEDLGDLPVPPPGAELLGGDRVVAALTTVAVSPGLGAVVALAYVRREVEPPARLELRWEAGSAPAEVRALPLVG